MRLALPRGGAGRQAGCLALLALIVVALLWLAPAAQAQSTYTVEDVPADVTAADAVTAREQAITEAERDGLRRLFGQLAPDTPPEQLPDAASLPIDQYVRSFEIASEQVGARRYIGRLNVTYQGERVREALRRAGVAPVTPPVPTLLLPAVARNGTLELWWQADAWRNALGNAAATRRAGTYLLPLGDAVDLSLMPPDALARDDRAAVAQLGQRYGARDVVLVTLAEPAGGVGAPAVELRGLGGNGIALGPLPAAGDAGVEPLAAAAEAALAALQSAKAARPPMAAVQSVKIGVPLADLAGWVGVRRELAALPEVRSVRVDSFSRRWAELTLSYSGDITALQASLGARGLALASENGEWQLLPAAAPQPQVY